MTTEKDGRRLTLDENDYTVDVDDITTRYTSESSGIVVEVEGRYASIQSRAEVPPTKRSRTASDAFRRTMSRSLILFCLLGIF